MREPMPEWVDMTDAKISLGPTTLDGVPHVWVSLPGTYRTLTLELAEDVARRLLVAVAAARKEQSDGAVD